MMSFSATRKLATHATSRCLSSSSLSSTTTTRTSSLVSARRALATVAATTTSPPRPPPLAGGSNFARKVSAAKAAAVLGGLGLAQYAWGEGENFFEHKFATTKSPQDLADFYGTEDFMEVFCVFPFVQQIMMRQAEFDDEGNISAFGLLGPELMKVTIDFDEKEEEINGQETITWFNKRETFKDTAPTWLGGFTLWEMTQNFGYNLKQDGTCEVYHHGEKFRGFFPVRLVFAAHSYYVIWATEKYVNSDAFGSEDRVDDAQAVRHNVPAHVFQTFISDLQSQLEKVKKDQSGDEKKQRELEVTLQRLNTVSKMNVEGTIRPRVRTLKSHRTQVTQSHLVLDDAEAKDAIRTAMNQLASHGSVGGRGNKSGKQELHQLQRRLTLAVMNPDDEEREHDSDKTSGST